MELFEAINQRQSVGKVRPDPVDREVIEKLLAAAVQAPNHHRVRPWRFIVLSGQARNRLGDVMAASLQARQPEALPAALEIERSRPLRSPVLIAVGVDLPSEPKISEIENICATAAAVQNLLLAAQALGLAAIWRTGPAAADPTVKRFLGLLPEQHLIGLIYLGYPLEGERLLPQRPDHSDRTSWLNE